MPRRNRTEAAKKRRRNGVPSADDERPMAPMSSTGRTISGDSSITSPQIQARIDALQRSIDEAMSSSRHVLFVIPRRDRSLLHRTAINQFLELRRNLSDEQAIESLERLVRAAIRQIKEKAAVVPRPDKNVSTASAQAEPVSEPPKLDAATKAERHLAVDLVDQLSSLEISDDRLKMLLRHLASDEASIEERCAYARRHAFFRLMPNYVQEGIWDNRRGMLSVMLMHGLNVLAYKKDLPLTVVVVSRQQQMARSLEILGEVAPLAPR